MIANLVLVAAIASAGVYVAWFLVLSLAPGWYRAMIRDNAVSVDAFVGGPPDGKSALKSWLLNRLNVGCRVAKKEGYPLKTAESDKVAGLRVTSRNESGARDGGGGDGPALPPVVVVGVSSITLRGPFSSPCFTVPRLPPPRARGPSGWDSVTTGSRTRRRRGESARTATAATGKRGSSKCTPLLDFLRGNMRRAGKAGSQVLFDREVSVLT